MGSVRRRHAVRMAPVDVRAAVPVHELRGCVSAAARRWKSPSEIRRDHLHRRDSGNRYGHRSDGRREPAQCAARQPSSGVGRQGRSNHRGENDSAAESVRRTGRNDHRDRERNEYRLSIRPPDCEPPRRTDRCWSCAAAQCRESTSCPAHSSPRESTTRTRSRSACPRPSMCSSTAATRSGCCRRPKTSRRWRGTSAKNRSTAGGAGASPICRAESPLRRRNVGSGHVFLFGPEITFRAEPHATFPFLFNAIYYSEAQLVTGNAPMRSTTTTIAWVAKKSEVRSLKSATPDQWVL